MNVHPDVHLMETTHQILEILQAAHIRLETGLSEAELSRAEVFYDFRFPPDLRELLATALPLDAPNNDTPRFPNWRQVPSDDLQARMDWPFDSLIWDVEHNNLRLPGWSLEPRLGEDLGMMTRNSLEAAPRLIPLYSHRFLPSSPCEVGNPVFSMYGLDTIYYGANLLHYFSNEFCEPAARCFEIEPTIRKIPFWSELAWDA